MSFLPNCILHKETVALKELAACWIPLFQLKGPVKVFVVSQTRGRCYGRERVITIPHWVIKESLDRTEEYIIHELSHQEDFDTRGRSDHGQEWINIFKRVCPEQWWHYEWNYKPQILKANGMMLIDISSTPTKEK